MAQKPGWVPGTGAAHGTHRMCGMYLLQCGLWGWAQSALRAPTCPRQHMRLRFTTPTRAPPAPRHLTVARLNSRPSGYSAAPGKLRVLGASLPWAGLLVAARSN